MKEFVLIFRNADNGTKPTAEEMKAITEQWMNWMGSIAAQNKLANPGNRLSFSDARVVKPGNLVTDGPYTEIKEFINGYIIVKANSVDEAAELAKNCPILLVGGNVEVRTVVVMENFN